jgi:hypothetical protein
MVSGSLELTIKIKDMPDAQTVANNWKQFDIDCDGVVVTLVVRPKVWKKLEEAQAAYPQWVAAIRGKLGQRTAKGFMLDEVGIQAFEKKAKGETGVEGG